MDDTVVLDEADEARVRRAGIRTNFVLAVVGGPFVLAFIAFPFIAGDHPYPAGPGHVDVAVEWQLDGRVDALIEYDPLGSADSERVAEAIAPTILPVGTPIVVDVDEYDRVHMRSRDPIAPTDGVLALDTAPVVDAMSSVGATTLDYDVSTPFVGHEVTASIPPDGERRDSWGWDDLGPGRAPAFEATLVADGSSTAIAGAVLLVGGAVALVAAIATTRRATSRRMAEKTAQRRFVVVLITASVGLVADMFVAVRFDAAIVAYQLGPTVANVFRLLPLVLFLVAGTWAFLGLTGSSARASMRAKIERERGWAAAAPPPPA